MTEKEIFEHLFEIAKKSKDPRGIVSACIVDGGKIIASAVSSDDGADHAEDILFDIIVDEKIVFSDKAILYATLLPCSRRSNPLLKDCTSEIIDAGIKHVVYGADDPDQFDFTKKKFDTAEISLRQISDPETVRKCALLFNDSVMPEQEGIKLKPLK